MEQYKIPVFLAIQARIKEKTAIRYIAEDQGHLMDEQPCTSYPACLVGISSGEFTPIAGNCQLGTYTITVAVLAKQISKTDNLTPEEYRIKGMSVSDYERDVHKALQGWSPAYMIGEEDILADITGSLERVRSRPVHSHKGLGIQAVIYSLGIDDYGTAIPYIMVPAPAPDFSIEISDVEVIEL